MEMHTYLKNEEMQYQKGTEQSESRNSNTQILKYGLNNLRRPNL